MNRTMLFLLMLQALDIKQSLCDTESQFMLGNRENHLICLPMNLFQIGGTNDKTWSDSP